MLAQHESSTRAPNQCSSKLIRESPGKSLSQLTDQALLEEYHATGNSDCMGELFQRYFAVVRGVCQSVLGNDEESRDAAMDIFFGLHEQLRRRQIAAFRSWLFKVSWHHCINRWKSLQKEADALLDWQRYKSDRDLQVEVEYWNLKGPEEILKEAIDALRPGQRTCIYLFYYEAMPYQAIAAKTGMSLRQVKSHLQNGKLMLRRKLWDCGLRKLWFEKDFQMNATVEEPSGP